MKRLFFIAALLVPAFAYADKTVKNVGTESITVVRKDTGVSMTISSNETVTVDDATADMLLTINIPANRGMGSIVFILIP